MFVFSFVFHVFHCFSSFLNSFIQQNYLLDNEGTNLEGQRMTKNTRAPATKRMKQNTKKAVTKKKKNKRVKQKKMEENLANLFLSHESSYTDESQVAESTDKTGHHNVSGKG